MVSQSLLYWTICRVIDYTIVCHAVQSDNWPCQNFRYNKMLGKVIMSNIKFKYGYSDGFTN